MKNTKEVLETIKLENGMGVDMDAAWQKLTNFQFGGSSGRGFGELIQNAVDSYDNSFPLEKRKLEIFSADNEISLIDYGEGFSLERIRLLMTLGGTSKSEDPQKIGMFGIGFFSMFNKRLQTKEVEVLTLCDGQPVKLLFEVTHPDKPPAIKSELLNEDISYSTKIKVRFTNQKSVMRCIVFAKESLKYLPVRASIDGKNVYTIWPSDQKGLIKDGAITALLEDDRFSWGKESKISMLCKYELLAPSVPVSIFVRGGRSIQNDLRDYSSKAIPYFPGKHIVINSNNLKVTISRDSYYLDQNWERVINMCSRMFAEELIKGFDNLSDQIIMANQYILKFKIGTYLKNENRDKKEESAIDRLARLLAHAPVYTLANSDKKLSLYNIKNSLSDGLPLYYSRVHNNLDWLGGEFKHDFIVTPDECQIFDGAPQLHHSILSIVNGDIVCLDTIMDNHIKITDLVERDIISKSALHPRVRFIGLSQLNENEARLIADINALLELETVKDVISDNLDVPIQRIRAFFFDVESTGALLCTGLFDDIENTLTDATMTNFYNEDEEEWEQGGLQKCVLGLNLKHPLIERLVSSNNRWRAFYAMTYLASELLKCQKRLVPFARFGSSQERLAGEMRHALMDIMLKHAA